MARVPPPVLENLAHYIINSESTKVLKTSIEDFLLRKYGATGLAVDPVDGLLRYLSESQNLLETVQYLADSRQTLISLANELKRDSDFGYCGPDATHDEAVSKVLEALEVPLFKWQPEYEGVVRIDSRLGIIDRELRELRQSNDPERLKHYGTVTWNYLETLLKVSINFYAEFFGYGDVSLITQAFDYARRQSSLSPLLDAIQRIEKSFARQEVEMQELEENDESGGQKYEQKYEQKYKQICLWFFNRESPFGRFLEDEIKIVPGEMLPDWIRTAVEVDQRVAHVQQRQEAINIPYLNKYKADIKFFRNFYAHADERAITNAGIARARNSFQAARAIMRRLDEEHICPVLILPIEDGYDAYGRRIVRFVHERDIKDNGEFSRRKVRHLFLGRDEELQLYSFYFCSSPAANGKFDPVMYPAQQILPS